MYFLKEKCIALKIIDLVFSFQINVCSFQLSIALIFISHQILWFSCFDMQWNVHDNFDLFSLKSSMSWCTRLWGYLSSQTKRNLHWKLTVIAIYYLKYSSKRYNFGKAIQNSATIWYNMYLSKCLIAFQIQPEVIKLF